MRVEVDVRTRVVLRRFYFPAWQSEPILPLGPTEQLRLLAFTVPAGRTPLRLERTSLWAERIGWSLSGQAFLLLLVWGTTVRWSIKTT